MKPPLTVMLRAYRERGSIDVHRFIPARSACTAAPWLAWAPVPIEIERAAVLQLPESTDRTHWGNMKLKNRLATGVLAIALLAGAGVATTAPAYAATWVSVVDDTMAGCKSQLMNKIREYQYRGAKIYNISGCKLNQWGNYGAQFEVRY